MSPRRAGGVAVVLALTSLVWTAPARAMTLARNGEARATIVVAEDASPVERTAAAELARYLEAASGAPFAPRVGDGNDAGGPRILVGTVGEPAREGVERLEPDAWVIGRSGDDVVLYGAAPHGTLRAVRRFLTRYVGVRWWTPWEQTVPRRDRLRVRPRSEAGRPPFAYRDVYGIGGPVEFRSRHGLNGHFAALPESLGGSWRFGPPRHAHTFFDYLPPDPLFDEHPEWFAEQGGLRHAGRSQLCLTAPGLAERIEARLDAYVREGETEAARDGRDPPRIYSISINDWPGACDCDACRASAERTGSRSGALVGLMNAVAARVKEEHPGILLETLAYLDMMEPPAEGRLADNVVVRFSSLARRDFSRPLRSDANTSAREALEGWARIAPHLWVWDYAVTFGDDGDLPLPNLDVLARDLRLDRALGVEGVLYQHDDPVLGDMRALKLWVLLALIDDPSRDVDELVREFTGGYYGAAGAPIRRYLRRLERHAARHPGVIPYRAAARCYTWLDGPFLARAQREFDRAERKVRGNRTLLERVRHARVSLDRATLHLWGRMREAGDRAPDRDVVVARYRETVERESTRRFPPGRRAAALEDLDDELAALEREWQAALQSADGADIIPFPACRVPVDGG